MTRRVLITGISGTGKSTVIAELRGRGYRAVDLDEPGYSELVSVPEDELTGPGPGHDWVWREERVRDLLASDEGEVLFVSGCSANQGTFYPRFDHIILLTAPEAIIVERLAGRTNNAFGKRPEEVERVLQLRTEVEPLLRRGAGAEIDTSLPLDQVVTAILRLAGEAPDRAG